MTTLSRQVLSLLDWLVREPVEPTIQQRNQEVADVADKITALIRPLTPEDRLHALKTALFAEADRAGTHHAKISNGTMAESLLCRHFGLKWNNKTVHGSDAQDALGRSCELKAGLYRKDPTKQCNIDYVLPKRRKDEPSAAYVARVYKKSLRDSGGHYWAAHTSTELVYTWKIDGKRMAAFLAFRAQQMLTAEPKRQIFHLNFGCKPCRTCHRLHRLDNIERCVNAGRYENAVQRVKQTCDRQ